MFCATVRPQLHVQASAGHPLCDSLVPWRVKPGAPQSHLRHCCFLCSIIPTEFIRINPFCFLRYKLQRLDISRCWSVGHLVLRRTSMLLPSLHSHGIPFFRPSTPPTVANPVDWAALLWLQAMFNQVSASTAVSVSPLELGGSVLNPENITMSPSSQTDPCCKV